MTPWFFISKQLSTVQTKKKALHKKNNPLFVKEREREREKTEERDIKKEGKKERETRHANAEAV